MLRRRARAAERGRAPRPGAWGEVVDGRHALSTGVIVLSILAPALNAFITSTVLPSAVAEIGGLPFYAWGSTAYAVTSIVGSAGFSVLTGQVGTRKGLLIASAIFVSGTATCAAAWSMPVMVAGRAVQGLGGGTMIAGAYGAVRELFPENLWPRLLAMISGAWGAAAMTGPAVGGFFAGLGLWRAAFWTMVPLVIIAAALSWRMLGTSAPRAARRGVPFGRLLLLCIAVVCVGSVANVGSAALQAALVVGAATAATQALRVDRRASQRLFPGGMLSLARPLGRGFWVIFLLAMSTSPGGVFISLLLQVIHGVTPATAGYLQASQSFSWTMATLIGARLESHRVRVAIVLGQLMVAAGFAGLFVTIGPGPLPAVAVFIVLVGAGIGTCWAHVSNIVLASGRPDEGALTASVVPTAQQFAIAFGAAVSGIVANAAGLSIGASRPVAALAGAALYGGFAFAPLAALIIAIRLRSAVRATAVPSQPG
jgi:predicted MFS family arabinose efflux permease